MSWINRRNAFGRAASAEECQAVGQIWMTPKEWTRAEPASIAGLIGFTAIGNPM